MLRWINNSRLVDISFQCYAVKNRAKDGPLCKQKTGSNGVL